MERQWQDTIVKLTCWLAIEIVLNLVGLDNLADYGEFVLGREFQPSVQPSSAIALRVY